MLQPVSARRVAGKHFIPEGIELASIFQNSFLDEIPLPANEKPSLVTQCELRMSLKTYQPCVLPVDYPVRCRYALNSLSLYTLHSSSRSAYAEEQL